MIKKIAKENIKYFLILLLLIVFFCIFQKLNGFQLLQPIDKYIETLQPKYNVTYNRIDDINDCDGPCFVIFNHLSRIDHMYVMGATYPRITNMIAGNNEFYRKKILIYFWIK